MDSGFRRILTLLRSSVLKEKTGLDRYGFNIQLRNKDASPSSQLSTQRIQATIENALQTSNARGISCVHDSFRKLVESVPHAQTVKLLCQHDDPRLPETTDFNVEPDSFGGVKFQADKNRSTQRWVEFVTINLPAISDLPCHLYGLQEDPGLRASFRVTIFGTPLEDETPVQGTDAASQALPLLRAVYETVTPLLNSTEFSSTKAVSIEMASTLMEKRELFEIFIHVQKIRVRTDLRRDGRIIGRATGHVRFGEGASTESKVGNIEASGHPDDSDGTSSDSVFVALGSNVGDRLQNIENACEEIDAEPGICVLRTSALYETDPMYVEDQNSFLNGACEVSANALNIRRCVELTGLDRDHVQAN